MFKLNFWSILILIVLGFGLLLIMIVKGIENFSKFLWDCITAKIHAKYVEVEYDYRTDNKYKVLIKRHWWMGWEEFSNGLSLQIASDLVKQLKAKGV